MARRFLKKDGHFVCKLFHSDDFSKLRDEIKKSFNKFEAVKPDSTRKISKEIFLVGIGKK
ncbi:Ribosomal RNA large subunit methyltransferase E [compost metagenome]